MEAGGSGVTTASTAGSVVAEAAPSESASRSATPGTGAATATSRAPGSRQASVSPWNVPIQPAPMSPTATGLARQRQ